MKVLCFWHLLGVKPYANDPGVGDCYKCVPHPDNWNCLAYHPVNLHIQEKHEPTQTLGKPTSPTSL